MISFFFKAATEEASLGRETPKTASPQPQCRGLPPSAPISRNSSPACLYLIGVSLVSVDEEACEEAVGPVRVVEESILLGVEDLQPDFVALFESQDGGARGHVVVAGVGIESPNAVLAVVHQADGEVFVGQRYVIGEVVDPRHAADELATGCIVVATLVHQNLVKLDGQSLPWIALGHRH